MLSDPHGTNPLTKRIIGCAIRVHRVIGPGVFENVYAECFAYELNEHGLAFETERLVPLIYKGVGLKAKYYVDFVVENRVIVELKAVTEVAQGPRVPSADAAEAHRVASRSADQLQRSGAG